MIENSVQLSKRVVEVFGAVLLIAYGLGFAVWNFHLASYGYFELNLLQARFVPAGVMTLIFIWIIYIIHKFLCRLFSKFCPKSLLNFLTKLRFFYYVPFVIFLSVFFLEGIFPNVSPTLGGARPSAKFIVGEASQIDFLTNFNISAEQNGDRLPVQTSLICEIYSNEDVIILGIRDPYRILILDRDNIKGLQVPLPIHQEKARDEKCSPFVDYM